MDPELQQEAPPNVNVPPPAVPDASGLPGAAPIGPPPNVLAANQQPSPTENHGNGIVPMIGHAFKSLLSNTDIVYNRDANGNLQAEHVPAQPGSLFKKILAASILGAASSSGPSFGRGVATGGAAALGRNEAVDAQARQRADQDFLARQKVAQQQMEQTRLGMEQTRLGLALNADKREDAAASISNIEHNLRMKMLQGQIQGQDYTVHQLAAQQGAAEAEPYRSVEAPAFSYGESEYKKILAADPSLSRFKWFPSGGTRTYTYKDADGKEQTGHENVWEAFNPDVKTTISADEAARYKKVGVELRDPNTGAILPLTAGYALSPAQRAVVSKQYGEKAAPYEAAQMKELEQRKTEATIKNLNAEAAMHYAQGVKAGRENIKDKKNDEIEDAKNAFESNAQKFGIDGAIEKLSFGQKSVLADFYRPIAIAQETAIRDRSNEIAKINDEISKSGDAAEKTRLGAQRDTLYQDRDGKIRQVQAIEKLANSAFGVKTAPTTNGTQTVAPKPPTPKAALTPEAVKWYGDNNSTPQAAYAAAAKDGWAVPPQYAPVEPTPTSSQTMAQIQAKSAARKALDAEIGPDYKAKIEAARKKGDTKAMSSLMNEYTGKLDAAQ